MKWYFPLAFHTRLFAYYCSFIYHWWIHSNVNSFFSSHFAVSIAFIFGTWLLCLNIWYQEPFLMYGSIGENGKKLRFGCVLMNPCDFSMFVRNWIPYAHRERETRHCEMLRISLWIIFSQALFYVKSTCGFYVFIITDIYPVFLPTACHTTKPEPLFMISSWMLNYVYINECSTECEHWELPQVDSRKYS